MSQGARHPWRAFSPRRVHPAEESVDFLDVPATWPAALSFLRELPRLIAFAPHVDTEIAVPHVVEDCQVVLVAVPDPRGSTTHPSGRTWTVLDANHIHFLTLEGADATVRFCVVRGSAGR